MTFVSLPRLIQTQGLRIGFASGWNFASSNGRNLNLVWKCSANNGRNYSSVYASRKWRPRSFDCHKSYLQKNSCFFANCDILKRAGTSGVYNDGCSRGLFTAATNNLIMNDRRFLLHQPSNSSLTSFRTGSTNLFAYNSKTVGAQSLHWDASSLLKCGGGFERAGSSGNLSVRSISRSSRHSLSTEKRNGVSDDERPRSLVQRFKELWRRYWYIVIPVHVGTSLIWFGGFYYASSSGLDIIGFLEHIHFMPESWLDKLKQAPQAGHIAVAYALYKLFSPARYAVTIGGTHVSMRLLSNLGLIPTAKEVRSDVTEYIKEKHHAYRTRRETRKRRFRFGLRRNGHHHHPSHHHHHAKKR